MSTSMKSQRPGGRASLDAALPPEEAQPDRPWEHSSVRDDVKHQFNLRLGEPLYLKLRYLAKRTNRSMQDLCMPVIIQEIDDMIAQFDAEDQRTAKAAERRALAAQRRAVAHIGSARKETATAVKAPKPKTTRARKAK